MPPPSTRYDAVVVGARAAGAAVAMLLARRGLRVLAVDRASARSDTLSSHALMRGAVARLHRWGLLERVWAAGTPVITRTTFGYDDAFVEFDGLGDETVAGLAAPRRTVLDPILVDAAVEAGATVRHATRLLDVETGVGGRIRAVRLADADGITSRVATDLLIGADGLRSTVVRLVGAPVTRQGTHASAFLLQYLTDVALPPDGYAWLYRQGRAAGLIPTNGAAWCVFVAVPPARFASEVRRAPAAAMAAGLAELPTPFGEGLARAVPAGPLRTWPGTPGRFRRAQGPGWALVGDAGYFKDPFAAHGISDAFRDAELLADAVERGELARYERDRDELSMPVFDALERIASYDWDVSTLPDLHVALVRAMRAEEQAVAVTTAALGESGGDRGVPLRRVRAGSSSP